ncbi:MAG: guanylyltransferase, partial [Methanobacterium paludis]|nr:guanylyltransferase [Methanobacterium paludis]
MKQCEIFSTLKVPCGSKIVLRIDGRKFSKLSSDLEFKKPYDINFVKTMVDSCLEFSREFSPSFVYTFSDEINILLSEIPFAGRIEKLNSVFPSFISSSFFKNLKSIKETDGVTKRINMKPVSFDSRVIPLSEDGVVKYFKNRQDEAWRNCLNGYAYWTPRKEHDKKEAVDILDKKKG